MNRWCQSQGWWVGCVTVQLLAGSLLAQQETNAVPPGESIAAAALSPTPTPTPGKSPVDLFRKLLALTPEERETFLTNRPPEIRQRILIKVGEYEALDPDQRELRLRATELRWYLMPLLREPATHRAARLAQVPDDVRELVEDRLQIWALLPPTLEQEFLDNERILDYFARLEISQRPPNPTDSAPSVAERAHWDSLPEPERRQVAAGFKQFFELNDAEKTQALSTLSDTERQQMENTLQAYGKMPANQRAECVNAFAKFAKMNSLEQAEFLRNAERWSAMTPTERQAWRDLVVNVPQWPPLPIGFMLPAPDPGSVVATNRN